MFESFQFFQLAATFLPTHSIVFFILAILIGVYLIVILIYICLMTNNVGHVFMCFFAICVSSLTKCLLKSFVHFFYLIAASLIFESWKLSIYFRFKSFIKYVLWQYFFSTSGSFLSLTVSFEE